MVQCPVFPFIFLSPLFNGRALDGRTQRSPQTFSSDDEGTSNAFSNSLVPFHQQDTPRVLMVEIRAMRTDRLIASGTRWDFSQLQAMIKGIFDFLDDVLSIPSSGHPDYRNDSPKKRASIACECDRAKLSRGLFPRFYEYALAKRAAI